MNEDTPRSAQFFGKVHDFLALQAHFSRQFNLLPSHWLTLYSALASVRWEHGQWICTEFAASALARHSLTSRETVRRSMQWLLEKKLIAKTNRRYTVSALTLSEIRGLLDQPERRHGRRDTRPDHPLVVLAPAKPQDQEMRSPPL